MSVAAQQIIRHQPAASQPQRRGSVVTQVIATAPETVVKAYAKLTDEQYEALTDWGYATLVSDIGYRAAAQVNHDEEP